VTADHLVAWCEMPVPCDQCPMNSRGREPPVERFLYFFEGQVGSSDEYDNPAWGAVPFLVCFVC
jgi:hypothetical protein